MTPGRLVEPLDEVEHGHAGLGLGAEAAAIEQLALKGGEECLGQRVVVGVADRSRAGADAGFAASHPKRQRGVLAGPGLLWRTTPAGFLMVTAMPTTSRTSCVRRSFAIA